MRAKTGFGFAAFRATKTTAETGAEAVPVSLESRAPTADRCETAHAGCRGATARSSAGTNARPTSQRPKAAPAVFVTRCVGGRGISRRGCIARKKASQKNSASLGRLVLQGRFSDGGVYATAGFPAQGEVGADVNFGSGKEVADRLSFGGNIGERRLF